MQFRDLVASLFGVDSLSKRESENNHSVCVHCTLQLICFRLLRDKTIQTSHVSLIPGDVRYWSLDSPDTVLYMY